MSKFPTKMYDINLVSMSIFIFTSHSLIRHAAFYIIKALNINIPSIEYFCRILMTIILCFLFYEIGNKLFPRTLKILTGGR